MYDEETGYCQGLSFLAAALLLHVCGVLTCFSVLCMYVISNLAQETVDQQLAWS